MDEDDIPDDATQDSVSNVNITCVECGKNFNYYSSMRRHAKRFHSVEMMKPGSIKCPACKKEFATRKVFLTHLCEVHDAGCYIENQNFDTFEEFLEWKKNTEKEYKCLYIKKHGYKPNKGGEKVFYYSCHRDGFYVSSSVGKRKLKRAGSNKMNSSCPAYIKAKQRGDKVDVEYQKVHFGHECVIPEMKQKELDKLNRKRRRKKIENEEKVEVLQQEEPKNDDEPEISELDYDYYEIPYEEAVAGQSDVFIAEFYENAPDGSFDPMDDYNPKDGFVPGDGSDPVVGKMDDSVHPGLNSEIVLNSIDVTNAMVKLNSVIELNAADDATNRIENFNTGDATNPVILTFNSGNPSHSIASLNLVEDLNSIDVLSSVCDVNNVVALNPESGRTLVEVVLNNVGPNPEFQRNLDDLTNVIDSNPDSVLSHDGLKNVIQSNHSEKNLNELKNMVRSNQDNEQIYAGINIVLETNPECEQYIIGLKSVTQPNVESTTNVIDGSNNISETNPVDSEDDLNPVDDPSHTDQSKIDISSFSHTCVECGKTYRQASSLRKHARVRHGFGKLKPSPGFVCPSCNLDFPSKKVFFDHLAQDHDTHIVIENLKFESFEKFQEWKGTVDRENKCIFIKISGTKNSNGAKSYIYYKCNRSGTHIKTGCGLRNVKSRKINSTCPAYMVVRQSKGELEVEYQKVHFGHSCDIVDDPELTNKGEKKKRRRKKVEGDTSKRIRKKPTEAAANKEVPAIIADNEVVTRDRELMPMLPVTIEEPNTIESITIVPSDIDPTAILFHVLYR